MTGTPSATVCPDCRTLIPATTEDRRVHREWHADLIAKHRGVQKKIGELGETASRAAAAVSDFRRELDATEIPEPVEPMRIEAWPEDELEPEQTSQYVDDEAHMLNGTVDDQIDQQPDGDPDDYLTDQPRTR